MNKIILNADVGEEAGFDAQIMPYISWCNISCGSHAGNEQVIQDTINLALKYKVKIGAHPSYPDRENFGRLSVKMKYEDLVKTITGQIQLVKYYTEKLGGKLHHVKPHGALYNDAIKSKEVALAVIDAVLNVDKSLYIVTAKDSILSYLCDGRLDVKYEAFADRNYNEDLTLVSRSENDAVITDPEEVFDHVFKMLSEGKVKIKKGKELTIVFDTICVHGDNPKSVAILRYLDQKFSDLNLNFK
ncbi:5-oxoprolinase subunit PxpA [Aquimarina celericrescens]|uniref:5-oxoprolinase subunit PxpA n=1 Tax=Aquimarina celericrescens TaxID=1964542 RepID=A0ABW5B278_9FLAO|nr:5-oxoprolinase subunit PxpA [Aquimarina celericrescens]